MRSSSYILLLLSMVVVVVAVEENGGGGRGGGGGGGGGCLSVVKPLTPCLEYLKGKCKEPSSACCSGVKELDGFAKTTKAKKLACTCIKNAMHTVKDINPKLIHTIPKKCHILTKLPPIGPNFNCSKIESAHEELIVSYNN